MHSEMINEPTSPYQSSISIVRRTHDRAVSRHAMPELCAAGHPHRQRAQGMPGEGLTHGPPADKKQAAVTTGSADIRHSLRDGFNAYTCSPRGPARLPPSPAQRVSVAAGLVSAPGDQDHTISRPHRLVRPCIRCTASPHGHRIPTSRIVTTARTSLSARQDGGVIHDFCKNERRNFRRSEQACRSALK